MLKKLVILTLCWFFITKIHAQQDLLRSANLTTARIDLLSEADVRKVQQQLVANKLTIEQIRPLLLNKGLSETEYDKLKSRLQLLYTTPSKAKGGLIYNEQKEQLRKKREQQLILPSQKNKFEFAETQIIDEDSLDTEPTLLKLTTLIDPRIFGAELFNPGEGEFEYRTFETDLTNLATPLDYEIGPGDQLKLVVYGTQEYSADLDVSREGNILITGVGQIKVGGLTIEAAMARIRQSMLRAYPTLVNGSSKLNLSLGEIRTIRVTIVGANRSGSFNISSLASIYAALSKAGGPKSTGSFRQIELIRNNQVIKKIDLYRLLA
ncbi:MAG: sugar transporter, partial [Chitinophagaceae bacterium]|nr:sugar transporter [Chitinophagaceae bacterium]